PAAGRGGIDRLSVLFEDDRQRYSPGASGNRQRPAGCGIAVGTCAGHTDRRASYRQSGMAVVFHRARRGRLVLAGSVAAVYAASSCVGQRGAGSDPSRTAHFAAAVGVGMFSWTLLRELLLV